MKNEPALYLCRNKEDDKKIYEEEGNEKEKWDFDRFDNFQHLEKQMN